MAQPVKLCHECGAKIVKYPHTLSDALVRSLAHLYQAAGRSPAHLDSLGLTYNQRCNFQKLRYWGLVAQAEGTPAKGASGEWYVTLEGERYLVGQLAMSPKVWTFRGRFESFEGSPERIGVPLARFYKRRQDYAREAQPRDADDEPTTGDLFDTGGA